MEDLKAKKEADRAEQEAKVEAEANRLVEEQGMDKAEALAAARAKQAEERKASLVEAQKAQEAKR